LTIFKNMIFISNFLWNKKPRNSVETSTFSSQNSGTFEPIIRFGWALLMKCWLLMRLSSWANLEFRRWQMSCWGCLEGGCKWIPRHFPPKMIHNFWFLMFPRFRRLYLTNLVELRSWRFFGGSIDSFKYSCNFQ
jgi:hypothetical protein